MRQDSLFPNDGHDPGGKVRTILPAHIEGDAGLYGRHQEYRLWLYRQWTGLPIHYKSNTGCTRVDPLEPYLLWIGMNPSTADAHVNDPTITREIGFTMKFDYRCYYKCNVMDYRATHPLTLTLPDVVPVSDQNEYVIRSLAKEAAKIICCWGSVHRRLATFPRELTARLLLDGHEHKMFCLGRTMSGAPRHPLYLKSGTQLEKFP
jgi:hypothetical protein